MAPKIRQVSHKIKAVTSPELFAKRYASKAFYPIVAFWIVIFTIPMLIVQMKIKNVCWAPVAKGHGRLYFLD